MTQKGAKRTKYRSFWGVQKGSQMGGSILRVFFRVYIAIPIRWRDFEIPFGFQKFISAYTFPSCIWRPPLFFWGSKSHFFGFGGVLFGPIGPKRLKRGKIRGISMKCVKSPYFAGGKMLILGLKRPIFVLFWPFFAHFEKIYPRQSKGIFRFSSVFKELSNTSIFPLLCRG
jgi:hypothetical protein